MTRPYEYDGRGYDPPYPAPEIPPDLSQELADAMEENARLNGINSLLLAACKAQAKLIGALRDMNAAYRLGRRPSEKAMNVLGDANAVQAQASAAIERAEGNDT